LSGGSLSAEPEHSALLGVLMIVILTCFQDGKAFLPLTRHRPVAMMPLMDVPIIQTHIEHFVEAGFSRFIVVAVDYPIPLEEFLGDGSRWGVSIETVVLKDPYPNFALLDRLSFKLEAESVIIMPAELVLNLDVPDLVAFQSAGNDPYVKVFARHSLELVGGLKPPKPTFKKSRLTNLLDTGIMVARAGAGADQPGASYLYDGNLIRIDTPVALWSANMSGLGGFFSNIAGRRFTAPVGDLRIGHHFRRGRETEIVEPALIGHHVRLNHQASLYGWTVIGNGVFVDKGAHIGRSVIADHTYVGPHTTVEHAIVEGKHIYNLEVAQWVEVSDAFLISDIRESMLTFAVQSGFWRLFALGFLMVSMPFIIFGGILRKIRGKPFFEFRSFIVTRASVQPSGTDEQPRVVCIGFEKWDSLLGRLPAVLNVISGRIKLVGVRPLQSKESVLYDEDWADLREDAPCGLFTPVDAEGIGEDQEEAKIVAENYYAATRSLFGDLKIFFLGVAKLAGLSATRALAKLFSKEGHPARKKLESG